MTFWTFIQAYELWKNGEGKEFLDETLDDTHSSCKLMRCLQIALQCVQEDPNDRPNMLEISHMLRNENLDMKHPKRPAFSIKKDEDGDKSSTLSEGTGQVDTATITRLVARWCSFASNTVYNILAIAYNRVLNM